MTDNGAAAFYVVKHHGGDSHRADAGDKPKRGHQARPGWFRDPRGEAPYRFWSGSEWTEHIGDDVKAEHPLDDMAPQATQPQTGPGPKETC